MRDMGRFLEVVTPVVRRQASWAMGLLGSDCQWSVDDLVQSAKAKLIAKFDDYDCDHDNPAQVAGWAKTVARRHFLDLKVASHKPCAVDAVIEMLRDQYCRTYPSPEIVAIVDQELRLVRESLTPRLRLVFDHLMTHGPASSRSELAESLDMTEAAVRGALNKILVRLKVTFSDLVPYIHASEVLAHGNAAVGAAGL